MQSKPPLGIQVWLAGFYTLCGCALLGLHLVGHRHWGAILVAAAMIAIGLTQVVYHYRLSRKPPMPKD